MLLRSNLISLVTRELVFKRYFSPIRRPKAIYDDEGNNLLKNPHLKPIQPDPDHASDESSDDFARTMKTEKKRSAPRNYNPFFSKEERMKRKIKKIEHNLKNNYDLIKAIMSINKSRLLVHENPLAILEGERLIIDALQTGVEVKGVYHSHKREIESFKLLSSELEKRPDVGVVKILDSDLKLASSVVTTPGVVAIITRPNYTQVDKWRSSLPNNQLIPVTLLAAGIRDPSNLGGLIRSAAAAGVQEVVTSPNSVHVWESKVVRTAAGAHFKVPIAQGLQLNVIQERLKYADSIICSETRGGTDIHQINLGASANTVLVVGSEAEGIPEEIRTLVSSDPFKSKTHFVSIPMSNGIDSLNNYVSASIILYELRRSFLAK